MNKAPVFVMPGPMSISQLEELLQHIYSEHDAIEHIASRDRRIVKYVDASIDFRTGTCFTITLRGYAYEKRFHTQNECRDLSQTLYERVMEFLDEPQL